MLFDELKYSRRHSAADEAALKACRTHLRDAMKRLDEAGAPDLDGDGVPDAQTVWSSEVKALNYDQAARAVRDAWYAQHPNTGAPARMPSYVESAYDNAVIVSDAGQLYRVSYRLDGERYYFADRTLWEPVRQAYVAEDGREIKAVKAQVGETVLVRIRAIALDDGRDAFDDGERLQMEQGGYAVMGKGGMVLTEKGLAVAREHGWLKAVPAIAPDAHPGAMVCFVTTPDTQELLRGLLPAELRAESEPDHLTICYLTGDAEARPELKLQLLRALADVAEEAGPIHAILGGLARFPASPTSDGKDVLVALVDAPGLDDLRVEVMDAACGCGIEPPGDHGFIPHITLAYIEPDAPTPEIRMKRAPMTFDLLTLVWAGERIGIPMLGLGEEGDGEDGDEDKGEGDPMARADGVLRQALAMAPAGEIKMLPDGRLLVKGIRYGGHDLVGDTFTKSTDLGASRSFVGMPVYYDHAQRGIKSQIGHVAAYEATDEGIDFLVELDRNHKYKATIERLYQAKALGGTTGALSHLVVREGGELKRWIVGELSVSPTPAEPRNLLSSTKAAAEATPEASTDAAGGELARMLAHVTIGPLTYRLRRRYE